MIRLDSYRTMAVPMLYSIVNMKLRDYYRDLDELAHAEDIDRALLEQRLGEAGFVYEAALNQFRPGTYTANKP